MGWNIFILVEMWIVWNDVWIASFRQWDYIIDIFDNYDLNLKTWGLKKGWNISVLLFEIWIVWDNIDVFVLENFKQWDYIIDIFDNYPRSESENVRFEKRLEYFCPIVWNMDRLG